MLPHAALCAAVIAIVLRIYSNSMVVLGSMPLWQMVPRSTRCIIVPRRCIHAHLLHEQPPLLLPPLLLGAAMPSPVGVAMQ